MPRSLSALCLCALVTVLSAVAQAAGGTAPTVSITGFLGDIADQRFVTVGGTLHATRTLAGRTEWEAALTVAEGQVPALHFRAWSRQSPEGERWSYTVSNAEPGFTVCGVNFPTVEGVCLGGTLARNEVYWPSMYRGARITELADAAEFERQAAAACKGVPYLYGAYQGDLSLPLAIQTGPGGAFALTVMDPTSEVVTLYGLRREEGMRYEVVTHPRVVTGGQWSFGEVLVSRSARPDWHPFADRYREWLTARGFGPRAMRGDICTMMYGRWGELRPQEAIRWARAYDARDVLLWVVLYGRGDQYYPCYFPPPALGVAGMTAMLGELRGAGLAPFFYTNGYLLSPLQQEGDARRWHEESPEAYPDWLAEGDHGYGPTVAEFRKSHDFAGDWLQTPGELEARRVRRVSFQWGEFPVYWWHLRPFWAACVSSPDWRKLFRDTSRLHAEMGAGGMFVDQVGAIHPELCAASGHGHDTDSFGLWNRAYLELLREVREAAARDCPGFFLEAEGAADRYALYMDKYLSNFGEPAGPPAYPQLLRYTAPWVRTDDGSTRPTTEQEAVRYVERALLLGSIFRVNSAPAEGPDDPADPLLTCEAMDLLRAGIQTRRALIPFMDEGRYRHTVDLYSRGCGQASWFEGRAGVLVVVRTDRAGASVNVKPAASVETGRACALNWRTGERRPAQARMRAGRLTFDDLPAGFHLLVAPGSGG